MKKLLTTLWILLIACFLCLIINFSANEMMIKDYNSGNYTENKLAFLGFLEPYISYYNKGNVSYKQGNYNAAIEAYQTALEKHPSEQRECMIRINLVLSMVAPIDPAELTADQIAETIQLLEDAKQILYTHGCATEDGHGHNQDAQQLKEDIDRFEEELKQMQAGQPENDTNSTEPEQTSEPDDENSQDIQKQFEELQKQSQEERTEGLSEIEKLENFDFYQGQKW